MILRQIFEKEVNSCGGGCAKRFFDWQIDSTPKEDKKGEFVRIGSFAANYWFHVSLGKTPKQTLSYAKRHLRARTTVPCQFAYVESETENHYEKICFENV